MSSRRLVPPVVTITSIDKCFPISFTMAEVWRANSRVGTSMRTKIEQSSKKGENEGRKEGRKVREKSREGRTKKNSFSRQASHKKHLIPDVSVFQQGFSEEGACS